MELTSLMCIHPTRFYSLPLPLFSPFPVQGSFYSLPSTEIVLFQAEILAQFRPTINTTSLIPSLRQVEEMTTKALEYFKSTRHIVIYYEDILKNRTVRCYY